MSKDIDLSLKVSSKKDPDYIHIVKYLDFSLFCNDIKIGEAEGIYIKLKKKYIKEENFIDVADSLTQDCYEATDVFVNGMYDYMFIDPKYFYLDKITIYQEHRNKGYGSQFFNLICDYLKPTTEVVYFKIFPMEDKRYSELIPKSMSRLKKFYLKNECNTLTCVDDNITIGYKYLEE